MKNTSLLVIAADSGEGQFTRLVDPVLKEKLSNSGIGVCECFMSQLKKNDLDLFDIVLVMRFPVPDHPQSNIAGFGEKIQWLKAFADNGGGLIIMFAECYGKTLDVMNRFCADLDIQFAFNRLIDSNTENLSTLPNMPEGKLICCDINQTGPYFADIEQLHIISEGGHGSQHLTCLPGDVWDSVLTGRDGCLSECWPDNLYAGTVDTKINQPVLGAWREYGKGKIVAFPASSSFWIANPYLKRWKGHLLEQQNGAGFEFIKNMIFFGASNSQKGDFVTAEALFAERKLVEPEKFSFRYVKTNEQEHLQALNPYKMWVGYLPEKCSLENCVEIARQQSYKILILLENYKNLTPDKWQERCLQYVEIGTQHDMLIIPGFEQLDGEGNHCVVFNVDNLPEMRDKYPNSNMLEDLLVKLNGYTAIYAKCEESRMPYWKHGGYNFIEVTNEKTLGYLRDRIDSRAFISGMVISRGELPGQEKWANWIRANALKTSMTAITENQHRNFISSGPLLKDFGLYGEALIEDDWEGYWYEWEAGDTAKLAIHIVDECELTEVIVWDGNTEFLKFQPDATAFHQTIDLTLEKDLNLHVTAKNKMGQELVASWPVYTRHRQFWAHMGSDQMNDYHNVFVENPIGCFGIGDKCYESYGFVTCGFAWGDYVRITPPVVWSDIMPQGLEISSLVCNFQDFHPSPFINMESGFDFLNMHMRKLGHCDDKVHIVHSHSESSWLDNLEGEEWLNTQNQIVAPTRIERKSELWQSDAEYHIERWLPGQACSVKVKQNIEWNKEFEFNKSLSFSFNHSIHHMKPGLFIVCDDKKIALEDFLKKDIGPYQQAEKEWDNLNVPRLLQEDVNEEFTIVIPNNKEFRIEGDEMGTVAFKHYDMSGRILIRGWELANRTFLLSFELEPEQKSCHKGDIIDIKYDFIIEA